MNEMISSPFTAPMITGKCPALLQRLDELPGGQTEDQVTAEPGETKEKRVCSACLCTRLPDPLQALTWSGWPAPLGLSEKQGWVA